MVKTAACLALQNYRIILLFLRVELNFVLINYRI